LDGENDECANVGSYYDNDDVGISVIVPIEPPFDFFINSPANITYATTNIDFDVRSSLATDIFII